MLKQSHKMKTASYIGIILIILGLVIFAVSPRKAYSLPNGFVTPITAFEFSQEKNEVEGIFKKDENSLDLNKIYSMDETNYLDFAFMILYSSFLFAFIYYYYKNTKALIFLLALLIIPLILIGDFLENINLLMITKSLRTNADFESNLYYLFYCTWLKWGGLGIIFLIIGLTIESLLFFKVTFIATFITGAGAFIYRSAFNEVFSILVLISFILLVIYAWLIKKSHIPEQY